ncbi:WXG100 family type VII secretion target, partial [Streptomyces qinglanensis]|uniref:WXG100 family type VII secretion target n=1 Tax=Streptomyces qinglanensis TaxID=943816 RepID=UPI003D75D437
STMGSDLKLTSKQLTDLASDLDGMQEHLKKQIDRLNGIVDRIEAGWRSPAASSYTDLQKSVNEDAVTVRKTLILIEEAVRMSRDGFDADELDILGRFQRIQDTAEGEREILAMADSSPPPSTTPSSKLNDL